MILGRCLSLSLSCLVASLVARSKVFPRLGIRANLLCISIAKHPLSRPFDRKRALCGRKEPKASFATVAKPIRFRKEPLPSNFFFSSSFSDPFSSINFPIPPLPASPAPRTARLSTGSEAEARTTSAEPRRGAAAEVRAARRAGEAIANAIFLVGRERGQEEVKEGRSLRRMKKALALLARLFLFLSRERGWVLSVFPLLPLNSPPQRSSARSSRRDLFKKVRIGEREKAASASMEQGGL